MGPTGLAGATGTPGPTGATGPSGAGSSILTGSVALVSSGVGSGYSGPSGQQNLLAAYSNAAAPLPVGGHISSLYGVVDPISAGSVTLTLFYNGSSTGLSCTVTSSVSSCSTTGSPVAVAAGGTIAVQITNATGAPPTFVRDVRWSTNVGA